MKTDDKKANRTDGPILPEGIGRFNERLNELIGDESVRAFGRRVGISDTTIRKYLSGETEPTLSRIAAIAIACDINIEWLISGDGHKLKNGSAQAEAAFVSDVETATYKVDDFLEEYTLVDGFHTQVSAGHGATWDNEQVRRKLAFRTKWLKYRGLKAENLRVVFAKGDSMETTIHSGDSILVDITATGLTDGSIFVVRIGEELFAKRVQQHIDGSVTIISDNKEYKEQLVPVSDLDRLSVVGKVVWIGKDVK